MTKKEMLKKLVDVAGKVESREAWHDDGCLTDADIRARQDWETAVAQAKAIGCTDAEIKKCKARGIDLHRRVWIGISEWE